VTVRYVTTVNDTVSSAPDQGDTFAFSARPRAGIARNAFNLVLGQVVTTTLTIVLSAVVARSLGPSDFGLLYLVTSVATFAYVLVDWGHAPYVIREVARHPQRTGELMGTVLAVRAAMALALCAPAVLTGWLLGYDGRAEAFIAVMMTAWLPMYLGLSYGWVFRGKERMEFDSLINVIQKFLMLVIAAILLALGGRLLAYMFATGVAGLATLGVATVLYRYLRLPKLRVTRDTARELIVGGAPMMTMTVAIAIQPYIDANMLSRLSSREVLGWYGAAATFSGTLVAPALILASAAYPRLSVAVSHPAEFKQILHDALRPLLLVAVLGGVGTYLFADFAVNSVYSAKKFGPSAAILRAFAPAMVLIYIDMLFGHVILAVGRAVHLAGAKVMTVLVTTLLEVLLIPVCQSRFGNGGIGVMLSLAGGEVMMIAALIYLMPRGTLDRSVARDLTKALIAGGATLLIMRAFGRMTPLIGVPVCVMAFSLLAVVLGLISRADLKVIASLLQRGGQHRPL
jgi:O-antigen/teichoic acid export membrane protein